MKTALVIGGRGQSGRAICARLTEGGFGVTATTAGDPDGIVALEPAVSWRHFARETDDLSEFVEGAVDVVVDVTAFTADHARQLVALGDRVGSAIVLSTLSVYSDAEGRSLDEAVDEASFPDWPVPIDEDWRTLPPGDSSYSTRKVAVEHVVLDEAPFPVTVVRPGAIHGRHSRHLREWYFIKRVLDGRRRVILPFEGTSVFQPTATRNLAELVACAADRPGRTILNCGDLEPPPVARISELVDEAMGWSTERVLVEGPPPGPALGDHPWAVPRPVVAGMSRAIGQVGYRQAVTYQDDLPSTVSWAVAAVSDRDWREVFPTLAAYPTEMFDYEAEDRWLAEHSPAD